MDILNYLLTGATAAAVVKLLDNLIQWWLNRKAKKDDTAKEIEEQERKRKEMELKEIVQTIESLKAADCLIMQDRIKHLCRSYLKDEQIDFDDLNDLLAMHSCYHERLGGNGNLNTLMELVKELPVVDR